MKNIFISLYLLLSGFLCFAQKDSINDKQHFISSLTISPVLTFKSPSNSFGDDLKYKHPSLSFSITKDYGMQIKSSIISVGFGFAYYSFVKNSEFSYIENGMNIDSEKSLKFENYYFKIPIKYLVFIGEKKDWFAGFNTEIAFLSKYIISNQQSTTYSKNGNVIEKYGIENKSSQKTPQYIFFGGLEFGRQIKLNKNFLMNLSLDLKYSSLISGKGGDTYTQTYQDLNIITSSLNMSFVINKSVKSVKSIDYSINKKTDKILHTKENNIFIEIGSHILTGVQSGVTKFVNNSDKYENGFTTDNNSMYDNGLMVNNRFFPSLSIGLKHKKHEFKLETSYLNTKNERTISTDWGRSASFQNKEFYVLLNYSHINLLKILSFKTNYNTSLYLGANILYQNKEREVYEAYRSMYNGNSNKKLFSLSNHIILNPEIGIKSEINYIIYFKLGIRLNAISYISGNYSWENIVDGIYPPTHEVYGSMNNYKKILFAGESKYFNIIDNVFLKIGFSF